MRFFSWPEPMQSNQPIIFPKDFVVRYVEGKPCPSIWSGLTKPEKSVIVAISSCSSLGMVSPSEALLAGLCGIRTRKSVRNAISKLENRNIIIINRGANRNIRVNFSDINDPLSIGNSVIINGFWQIVGDICPSSHALYVTLLALMRDEHSVQDSSKIICGVAGISTRHYKVALSVLVNFKLASLWDWPNRRVIPTTPDRFFYQEKYLERFPVE